MRLFFPFYILIGSLLMAGCATVEEPEVVVDDTEVLLYLEKDLRPEPLLFPEYLLMENFEIDQHGRIPNSSLVCAGLKTKLDLAAARQHFDQLLASKGWNTIQSESTENSFRLLTAKKGESLEIRAVQGTAPPVQILLLYRPGS